MIQAIVRNLSGVITNQATFQTQASAEMWVAGQSAVKAFGKPDRWISQDDLAFFGEDKMKAVASQDTGGPDDLGKTYHFLAEYAISYVDVTAQVAQQALVAKGLYAQQLGAEVVAAIYSSNEAAGITSDQLTTMLADPAIALIERLLWNGSLVTARVQVAALNSAVYPPAVTQSVLLMLDGFIHELVVFVTNFQAQAGS